MSIIMKDQISAKERTTFPSKKLKFFVLFELVLVTAFLSFCVYVHYFSSGVI